MRLTVAPFRPADLAAINAQNAQGELAADRWQLGRTLSAGGRCFTIRDPAGRVVFCGGAAESHAGHATLWAAVGRDAGPWMAGVNRRVQRFVAGLPHRRIDAAVRASFAAGRRWMGLLGFEEEATLGALFEDGEDGVVYRYRGAR